MISNITPLPWKLNPESFPGQPEIVSDGDTFYPLTGRVIASFPQRSYHPLEAHIETDANVKYALLAANLYPRLHTLCVQVLEACSDQLPQTLKSALLEATREQST